MVLKYLALFSPPSLDQVPPKITPFTFGNEPANHGDSVSISCVAPTGDLPISFEWLHNNEAIDIFSFGVSISKLGKRTSAMTIDSISGQHAGNYSCKATNEAASEYYNAHLIVNGTLQLKEFPENNLWFSFSIKSNPYRHRSLQSSL